MQNSVLGRLPWRAEGFRWKEHLSGAPLKLLGLLVGIGRADCPIEVSSGNEITVECNNCEEHAFVTWQQICLLVFGMIVVMIGVGAAIFRNKRFCKWYGLIMMVYSFVIGLTALLTGLDSVVLHDAVNKISDDHCKDQVQLMINTSRINAILFAINALLDIAGAIYAIKSKELFEFQEIAEHHTSFHKSYQQL